MVPIALRNLLHDKIKLVTALVGVVFSVLLTMSLTGLFIGNMHNTSGLIDNAGADVWVAARGTRNVDFCDPLSERRLYQALATPGVAWAEKLIVEFAYWKLPDGRQENAAVVGVEPRTRFNLPWGVGEAARESILHDHGVTIDERERKRFGTNGRPLALNDRVEILGTRARVAAFTSGVGTFTMSPYVFTTHKQAMRCGPLREDQTKFILVKARPDVAPEILRNRLMERMPDTDVYTAREFAAKTRRFWLFGTGMGVGIIFSAGLGCLVGMVIVGQTIYSATLERLGEYGTLKAIGMTNPEVGMIIVRQAILTGAAGYAAGAALSLAAARHLPKLNLAIELPPWLFAAMFAATIVMCVVASVTSIVKVFRLPPAMVFRS